MECVFGAKETGVINAELSVFGDVIAAGCRNLLAWTGGGESWGRRHFDG